MDDENLNSEELETKTEDSDKEVITEEAPVEVVQEAPKAEETEAVNGEVPEEPTIEEAPTEENVVEELPVEGAAVAAVASEDQLPEDLAEDVKLGLSKAKAVEYDGAVDDLDVVEQDRQDILKRYKKQNRWSYVIMIAVLVLVVAGFVLVVVQSSNEEMGTWMMIVGYVLIGVGIVGMIIQYIFNRRRLPKRVDAYAAKAIDIFNAYNYSNPAYSKVYYDELEKVEPSEILADRVYYNVSDTKSQAVVRGSFGDAVFKSANVCVMVQGEKKKSQETVFLGRYITYPNSLKIDNRIILNFKGVKPIDLPTDTMDLVKLEDSDLFTVYGPEGASYKKLLGSKFISALQKIEVSGSLLNMNVVVWAGHTAVYMTYVDEFVSIPYQEPVNKDYYAKGRDDILNVLTALKIINK